MIIGGHDENGFSKTVEIAESYFFMGNATR